MSGRKQRTNRPLLITAVILCLACGVLLTRTSPGSGSLDDKKQPDMFVAENTDTLTPPAQDTVSGDTPEVTQPPEVQPTDTPVPEPTTVPADDASTSQVSPEAASGVWTSSGSNWYFMVNGAALTGWLTDTDNKRYYFDGNGVMQTGWLDDNGNRYYLNGDGVMQTGDVIVDGQLCHFSSDGVMNGDPSPISDQTESSPLLYYINPNPEKADASSDADPAATDTSSDQASTSDATTDTATATAAPAAQDSTDVQTIPQDTPVPTPTPVPDKKVALTFDDGPSDYTARLLDCLEANNAKATFFLVGNMIDYYSEDVTRMEALGCELGNHSYDHTDLSTLSAEEVSNEIGQTDQLLNNLVGHGATVVRPPYGNVNDTVTSVIATPMILWTVDPEDWDEGEDVDRLVNAVLDNVTDGSIVLMHDIFSSSVDAAEILIPRLIQEGYELVTVHQLAESKGITLQGGVLYNSLT